MRVKNREIAKTDKGTKNTSQGEHKGKQYWSEHRITYTKNAGKLLPKEPRLYDKGTLGKTDKREEDIGTSEGNQQSHTRSKEPSNETQTGSKTSKQSKTGSDKAQTFEGLTKTGNNTNAEGSKTSIR